MKSLEQDNSGNVNVVMALATTAIVLYVVVIVIGKLAVLGSSLGLSTESLASYQNVSALTFSGTGIAAIGILVMAGVGILSYFGIGFGKK